MIGKSISHYRILEKLGEGGMGVVYKAEDTKLERTVAVKFLRPEVTDSEETNARFLQEAKAAARLDHPHICTIHEIDQVEGQTLMAMAYVDGPSLKERIEERPLKIDEALEIALQIGDGLAAAHEAGIVHRDIKPGNILLNRRGQVKILDFGLAHLGAATRMTKTGTIIGTPGYMAPEQVRGDAVDRRADVWAFGVVLYEMVTGRLPFQGETAQTIALMIQNETPEPVTALRSGVPIELDRVVGKSLAKDPRERYQSVDDLLVNLRSARRQAGIEMSSQWESSAPQRRRAPRLAWILGLGAVLLAAVGGAWFWRPSTPAVVKLQTPVPLTSYPGEECHASFSPDGNQVTFCWNGPNQDNFDIYIKLVGPGEPINLTDHPSAEGFPQWSPDGRSIAFLRQVASDQVGVFVIPALGGSPATKIAEFPGRVDGVPHGGGGNLAWSPDSKWLLGLTQNFLAAGSRLGLTLWSATTGEEAVLAMPSEPRWFVGASFSPDGRRLAFVGGPTRRSRGIHVLPLGEDLTPLGEPERLTDGLDVISNPLWNEDGSEILFGVKEGLVGWRHSESLWKVRSDGEGGPEQLDSAKENASYPAVSWRSGRLVYSQGGMDTNIWRLDPSTSAVEKLAWMSSTRSDSTPRFSPDGRRVAVSSARSGVHEVWLYDRDQPRARQLTHFGKGLSSSPCWSPDGTKIAFDSNAGEDSGWDVYVMDAEGGAPRRMTNHSATDTNPNWSRDGNWIYFTSNRTGTPEVWKLPAGGGEPVKVTTKGGRFPRASVDGKRLYFTRDSALFSVPVEGIQEEKVLDYFWRACYAVASNGIYFVRDLPEKSRYSIEFFDFETSTSRVLREQREPIAFGLTVPLDGSEVIYSQIDQQEYDLMLVENFQ